MPHIVACATCKNEVVEPSVPPRYRVQRPVASASQRQFIAPPPTNVMKTSAGGCFREIREVEDHLPLVLLLRPSDPHFHSDLLPLPSQVSSSSPTLPQISQGIKSRSARPAAGNAVQLSC